MVSVDFKQVEPLIKELSPPEEVKKATGAPQKARLAAVASATGQQRTKLREPEYRLESSVRNFLD
jgi:hypothetical protein